MPIRKFNPTSPGSRFQTVQTFDDITTDQPYKPLVEPLHRSGGRIRIDHTQSMPRGKSGDLIDIGAIGSVCFGVLFTGQIVSLLWQL